MEGFVISKELATWVTEGYFRFVTLSNDFMELDLY
jgi:hypothetical protein